MPHKDNNMVKLARLSIDGKNPTVQAANLSFLSNEEIEGYEKESILLFLGYSDETICSECIKGSCTVPVKRAVYPDGRNMALYRCPDPDHGGRFEIKLEKLRYWRINTETLRQMGYLTAAKKGSTKKRKRRASSELSPRETEVYRMTHVEGKTPKEIALILKCTDKNIYKHLGNAEKKLKAKTSRSVSTERAQDLPHDNRGQENLEG